MTFHRTVTAWVPRALLDQLVSESLVVALGDRSGNNLRDALLEKPVPAPRSGGASEISINVQDEDVQ